MTTVLNETYFFFENAKSMLMFWINKFILKQGNILLLWIRVKPYAFA